MTVEELTQELALTLPWIGKSRRRVESLSELLEEAEAAQALHGPALVGRLLERFTFLSVEQYEQLLLDMATFIVDTFDLNRDRKSVV